MVRLFFLLICVAVLHFPLYAQIDKVGKEYFRVNPFEAGFSAFVKTLAADPELLNKTIVLKTDTTNYFVKGSYKIFNPFAFNAEKIDVIFAEETRPIAYEGGEFEYSNYAYQILAYFSDNEQHRKLLAKNFNRIDKKLTRGGAKKQKTSLKGIKNIEDGMLINYYFAHSVVYPATLSWQTLASSKKLVLTIVLRLTVANNQAHPAGMAWETENED